VRRLLLVEDDPSLGQTLSERLAREGHSVDWVQTAGEARQAIVANRYSLLILDVGLPDGNGFDLARLAVAQATQPRVLFMTALATAENRLLGYEIGASDFLPKPFHIRELLIRIERLIQPDGSSLFRIRNDVEVDLEALQVRVDGRVEPIPARDAQVLRLLLERAPAVVSRDQILDQVWGEDQFPSHRTVDNSIVRIRSLLGDRDQSMIHSVRGVGYQILVTVERVKKPGEKTG
jgi:DNA-binding response OmpR family regulator